MQNNHQTSILILVFLSTCVGTVAMAQADSTQAAVHEHGWSLDFAIDKDFMPQAFLGSMVSLSRCVSESERIRVGVASSLRDSHANHSVSTYVADTLNNQQPYGSSSSEYQFQLIVQYMTYTPASDGVSGYAGIGPLLDYYTQKSQSSSVYGQSTPSETTQRYDSDEQSYGIGACASLGVDWSFSRHMSLHAEYGVTLIYAWGDRSTTTENRYANPTWSSPNQKTTSRHSFDGWGFRPNNVLFGLSVKF